MKNNLKYTALSQSFFAGETVGVSKQLLGKFLVRSVGESRLVARIVETEAYLSEQDPAAHTSSGRTERTKVLYEEPGSAYVFKVHASCCLNVVVEPEGRPGCVLIRAAEPVVGTEPMREYRRESKQELREKELTNGPGKLCQALSIDLSLYGADMTSRNSALRICENDSENNFEMGVSRRVGISKAVDLPLRFFVEDNKFVSSQPQTGGRLR